MGGDNARKMDAEALFSQISIRIAEQMSARCYSAGAGGDVKVLLDTDPRRLGAGALAAFGNT